MALYEMPDGQEYEFASDEEATRAMLSWQTQFGSKEDTVPRQLGRAITGGVGAALDFVAPANLAVPGLIEGARALVPEALGGISAEQAATNITSGSIPGTNIKYSDLSPSSLLENFTGEGSIRNKEYERANTPLHKLSEVADKVGSFVNDISGSPTAGTMYNLAVAGALLHGTNVAARKVTEPFYKVPPKDKMNAAREESERIKKEEAAGKDWKSGVVVDPETGQPLKDFANIDDVMMKHPQELQAPQYGLGGKVTMPEDSFGLERPRFEPGERAVQSTYDLTEREAGSQPIPGTPKRLGYSPGEPLVTFPDGTTMTRAEFENYKKSSIGEDVDVSNASNPFFKGKRDVNVEEDSISGRPIFPQDVIDIGKQETGGREVAGLHIPGENGYRLNPDYISELWFKLSEKTKEKYGLKTAEDLSNFIELHERQHWSDQREYGNQRRPGEKTSTTTERRINDTVVEQTAPLRQEQPPSTNELPGGFREPYEGAPKEYDGVGRTPAQMRANYESLVRQLESVNRKIKDFEDTGKEADIGKLQKKRDTLENLISTHQDSLYFGRNKLGLSFEPKRKTLGGVGKKQGGSIDPSVFKEGLQKIQEKLSAYRPSLKEFAEHIGRGIDDKVTTDLYKKYYGKEVTQVTPENTVLRKIPGLKEVISPDLIPLSEMKDRWKTETDLSSKPLDRALRENLSSGGRVTAQRTGNSFIDWNIENILGETRKAQVVIKKLQNDIKGEVNKLTGPLLTQFKKDSKGVDSFIEAMTAMLKSEGKFELPKGISPEAATLVNKIRSSLDDLGKKIQEELLSQGVTDFQWRPNYLAGVFFGPYRSVVKDATGEVIGVIAGRTKKEATAAIDHIKQQMPDVSFDLVEYNPKYDEGPGSLGARYGKASEVLELLRNQSDSARVLQESLSEYYTKVQENYMGYKQHFKTKKGVFGSEGSRPWENARNNAFDLLEAQLGIIDHGYHWLAEQKLMKDMNDILADPNINLPESKRYVLEYLDHAFGRTPDKVAFFSSAMDFSAQLLGISPSSFREMTSILRNTALTGTLGVSLGFVGTQFLQVPTALAIAFSKAKGEGVVGNKAGSSMIGSWDLINGINGKFENMSAEGKYYFQYFAKNGVLDPHLVEHTIHRKIVTTTGMSPIGKAIWESVNGAFKGMEAMSDVIGKYTIERPEVWTRGSFAMTMAHFYKSAGYSMKEAAIKADKDTSTLFVDYSSQERAMIFQRMGEMGKLASTVSTFKLNNLNQWFTFSNKKMYGALAALALTTWFTTGLNGMPGMDEAEFGTTYLKSKGIDIPTPREFLLSKVPDPIAFGPLSSTPKWVGELTGNPNVPAASIHRKFAQDNVIPDDLQSFIYPLLSFYTQKISKGKDMISSGFAKLETGAFVREVVPGNLKFGVDYGMLTNDKGLTIDHNQIKNKNPAHYDRSRQEWKMAVGLGVVSQREWKDKQINQLDKISEQAWKESTKSMVERTISAFNDGNEEKYKKLASQAIKYNPGAAEEIKSYIEQQAISRNVPLEKMLEIKFAKGANSPHGVARLKQFQEMRDNK